MLLFALLCLLSFKQNMCSTFNEKPKLSELLAGKSKITKYVNFKFVKRNWREKNTFFKQVHLKEITVLLSNHKYTT